MKHLFGLVALVSLLICLVFVVLAAMTLSSEKTIALGQSGERTYSFRADSLEFTYQGKLTTFDNVEGFTTTKSDFLGCEYDVQHRKAKGDMKEATGFILVVPAWYPIALFAILPIAWVVGRMRGKNRTAPGGFETTPAAGDPPVRGA